MYQNQQNKPIGALWVKTAKSTGKQYMSGVVEIDGKKTPIVVFPSRKKHDRQPDYSIMLSGPAEARQGQEANNQDGLNEQGQTDISEIPM